MLAQIWTWSGRRREQGPGCQCSRTPPTQGQAAGLEVPTDVTSQDHSRWRDAGLHQGVMQLCRDSCLQEVVPSDTRSGEEITEETGPGREEAEGRAAAAIPAQASPCRLLVALAASSLWTSEDHGSD